MPKKNNKCWNCGKATMGESKELGKDWLKCSNCGATDNSNPVQPRRIADMDTWKDAKGTSHYHPAGVHY